MAEFWETDFDFAFELGELGVIQVTYATKGKLPSDGVPIPGVFRNPYESAQAFGYDLEGSRPTIEINTKYLPNVKHGDTITAPGKTYNVVAVEPGETGQTVLTLSED